MHIDQGVELPVSELVPGCWRKGECGFYRLVSPLFAHFPWLEVLGSLFQEEEEQRTRSLILLTFCSLSSKCLLLHRGKQEAVRNKSLLRTMAKNYGHKPSTVNTCHSRFLLFLQAQAMHRLGKCPVPEVLCQPGLCLSKEKGEALRG